jgi:hypothetical protein
MRTVYYLFGDSNIMHTMPAPSINLPDAASNSIVEAPHSRYFLCSVWQQADLTEVQNEAPSPSLCQLVNVHVQRWSTCCSAFVCEHVTWQYMASSTDQSD